MTVAEIALYAFSFVNAVRVFSYIPQIIKIWRDKSGASGVSYTTWGMFTISHLTTVTYAIYVVNDWKMALVFVGNFISCVLILGLTAWKQGLLTASGLARIGSWLVPMPLIRRAAYACSLVAIGSFVGASLATHGSWARLQEAHATTPSGSHRDGGGERKGPTAFEPAEDTTGAIGTVTRASSPAGPAIAAALAPMPGVDQTAMTQGAMFGPGATGVTPTLVAFAPTLTMPGEGGGVPSQLERAEQQLRAGDVSGARAIFTALFALGDARGAQGMARSFDPAVLARTPAAGNGADRAEMAKWQRRAAEMAARQGQGTPSSTSSR